MDKRQILALGALGSLALAAPLHAAPAPRSRSGPALLTVAGATTRSNRGALDPALDQLLVKHGSRFDMAWAFDATMLARLPAVAITPTLEYDAKPHQLSGPLLSTVVEAAGVAAGANALLALRAIDGYTVAVPLVDVRRWRMIVATMLDGAPLGLGGLGPQWAVYDADRIAEFKDKPLKERFALCPWGLYFIDVKPV